MTTKTESTQHIDNEDNEYLSLLARLDEHGTRFAIELDKIKAIYQIFAILDALSLSYSMFKLVFDLLYTNTPYSSADMLHEWLNSPEGIAAAAAESLTLIAFSFIANSIDKKSKDATQFQRYLVVLWPYCRDALKGMKNAYKGVRSTLQVMSTLSGHNLKHMIVPMGLILGATAVLNRLWLRHMRNDRKDKQAQNSKLLSDIQKQTSITSEEAEDYLKQIGRQSSSITRRAFLASAYAGFVDGLYLYMGAMSFTALSPPLFVAMSAICVCFSIVCIATRLYEEYDYQRKLRASEVSVELAVCSKRLDAIFKELQALSVQLSAPNLSKKEIQQLERQQALLVEQFNDHLEAFGQKRHELIDLKSHSFLTAFLAGLQDGLAAYSAIMSGVYAVATISALMFVPLPPVLLVSAILLGVASLVAFAFHSVKNKVPVNHEAHKTPPKKLGDLLKAVKDDRDVVKKLDPDEYKEAMEEGLKLGETPQHFTQEWFEVVRSFLSGVAKGQKTVSYAFNSLQVEGEDGHYHDSPVMNVMTVVNSCIFAVGLALRALARGLKNKALRSTSASKKVNHVQEDTVNPVNDERVSNAIEPDVNIPPPSPPPPSQPCDEEEEDLFANEPKIGTSHTSDTIPRSSSHELFDHNNNKPNPSTFSKQRFFNSVPSPSSTRQLAQKKSSSTQSTPRSASPIPSAKNNATYDKKSHSSNPQRALFIRTVSDNKISTGNDNPPMWPKRLNRRHSI